MLAEFVYPVFLSLRDKKCLVCGFGSVGRRKARGALDAGAAQVLALDPFLKDLPEPEMADFINESRFSLEKRHCEETDIRDSFLVFAAASDRLENRRIAELCHKHAILCNCATEPGLGGFIVPAVARCRNIEAALSTGGASPLLARKWRSELEKWLEPRAALAWLMGRLRPSLVTEDCSANAENFNLMASSPLSQWLNEGNLDACAAWLAVNFKCLSREKINRVLAEFKDVFAG